LFRSITVLKGPYLLFTIKVWKVVFKPKNFLSGLV
jgi:hypothetical protein